MAGAGEMVDAPSLSSLLTQHMAARGLTQRQLATRAGVSTATLHRWLTGKSVHPYHRAGLLSVAATLGLSTVQTNRLLRAAGFPTLAALAAAPAPEEAALLAHWSAAVRHNLPADLTSFVGRTEELTALTELLCQDGVRLVTLTGTGGSGKTRLALRAAREVLDSFPDGVFAVLLAAVADPRLVLPTIAETIGLRDVQDAALPARLAGWLSRRRVLLLLDNLEQLVESGPEIVGLLRAAPGLKVLVTSRVPLHLSGEHTWPVEPFPVPRPDESRRTLRANPAVALFVERAQAANPRRVLDDDEDLTAVGELCTRLDGLPLAIELAAARTRDRAPERLLADFPSRLDLAGAGPRDVPPRQQTLRDAIAWSVNLLPEPARAFLLRLAVFAGGWTAEAARAVCVPDGLAAGTVDGLLTTLVEAHLIERIPASDGTVRYRMLETIGEYGLERLTETGAESAVRERHARYFLALAESAPPYVPETRLDGWYERIDAEVDNLRAALAWADTQDDVELLARFAAALWPYWHEYLRVAEGRRWLDAVLAQRDRLPPSVQASLLTGACLLASTQAKFDDAEEHGQAALALWEELGDHRGQALIFRQRGMISLAAGVRAQTIAHFEAALAQWRLVGDPYGIAREVSNLALANCVLGDLEAAVPYLAEAEERYRRLGDTAGLARLLTDRGLHALLRGDVAAAIPLLQEAVDGLRVTGGGYVLPGALFYLGTAYCFSGKLEDAVNCYAESLRLYEELGDQAHLALTLLGFAAVAHRQGEGRRSAILCGAAQAMRQTNQLTLLPAVAALYEREIGMALEQIGPEAFAQAFAQGSELTTAEALAFAREGIPSTP